KRIDVDLSYGGEGSPLVQCPRSSFQSKYLGMCKNPLISTAGGRFPRARLQPPRETHSVGSSDTCYSRWSRRLPFQSTRVALYTMWNHLRDNVPSNWNMRDSCGRKGLDETPQSVARGGSLAARGKRVYSSCGDRRGCFVPIPFPNTQLCSKIWKELLKRSTSRWALKLDIRKQQ